MTISACYKHRESKLGSSQGSISAVFWAINYSTEESKLNACQMFSPFARLTSQHSTDNYLEILKLAGCYIYNLNWHISVFIWFHFWPPSTYQKCITLREWQSFDFLIGGWGLLVCFRGGGGLLFVWFVGFSFRKFWTCTWKMGKRETSCIWTPGLQSDGHCCVVAFSDKDTVQRWRTGITPLPAASQELQLLLLICFAVGTDDFLLTAGPQRPLWPTDRPGWVCSSPF